MAKIAVIDDAPEVIALIAEALAGEGHELVAVANDLSAEERIAREGAALLLLDVVMPGRNGFEILRGLRKAPATRELPVVVVSRKSNPSDQQWARMQGATDVLAKPFTTEDLVRAVARNLR